LESDAYTAKTVHRRRLKTKSTLTTRGVQKPARSKPKKKPKMDLATTEEPFCSGALRRVQSGRFVRYKSVPTAGDGERLRGGWGCDSAARRGKKGLQVKGENDKQRFSPRGLVVKKGFGRGTLGK